MTITERFIYAIFGAMGAAGIAIVAQLFWLDEIRWPLIGGAATLGGLIGFLVCDRIWELLRGLWDMW